jgi:MFS family permease
MRRDYLAFFISLFLSRLGDQVLLFLVPLLVFQSTNSASWAGLAFFVESLPRFLAFPVCGALCDRFSPIRILHLSQVCRAISCVFAMALFALFDGIYWLVILSAVCGVLTTQGVIAREVLMPHVFAQYRYAKTLSYSQIADQAGLVLGPLLAALLLQFLSWPMIVLGVAGLFVLADVAMGYWQRNSDSALEIHAQHPDVWLQPLKIAFGHIRQQPELRKVISLAVGVNLVVGVTLATSAAMVIGSFGETQGYYAWLQAAGAVTTIVILFGLARISLPLTNLGVTSYTAIVLGGLLCATSAGMAVYVLGFLLITGFDKMFNVYMRSTRQRVIPVQDFGKTVGVITLLNNLSQPLAGLWVGIFSYSMGLRVVMLDLALLAIVIGSAVAIWVWLRVEQPVEP